MVKKVYEEQDIQNIANAIRTKGETTDTYKVSEMASAIENLPSGGGDIGDYFTNSALSNEAPATNISPILWHIKTIPDIPMINFCYNDTYSNTISYAFSKWSKITNLNTLSKWDTSNVNYMDNLFEYCYNLTDISGIRNWNIAKVYRINNMFASCKLLTNLEPISNWKFSGVCTNFSYMFRNCTKLVNAILPNMESSTTSKVNINGMFYSCSLIENIDLRGFSFECSSIGNLFYGCSKLKVADIRNIKVSSITSSSSYSNAMQSVPTTAKIIVKDATEKAWWQSKFANWSSCFYTPEEAISAGIITE